MQELKPEQIAELKALLATVGLNVTRKRTSKAAAETRAPVRYVPQWLADDDAMIARRRERVQAHKFRHAFVKTGILKSLKNREALSLASRAFVLGRPAAPYAIAERAADMLNGKPAALAIGVDRSRRRVRAFDKAAAYRLGVGTGPVIPLPYPPGTVCDLP